MNGRVVRLINIHWLDLSSSIDKCFAFSLHDRRASRFLSVSQQGLLEPLPYLELYTLLFPGA